ncbi:hypothetical protein ACP70R_030536 [Stipagrostis hirtigluma subsp. patula]
MRSRHSKLHALLGLLLYLCTIHSCASVPCHPADVSALLQLKRSFLNPNLPSWRAGADCCLWEGVACDAASGRVIALDLSERGLQSRALDPAIFNLTSLRNLSLAYNDFMGASLPSSGFELLTKMVHLNLRSTSFFGQIPVGIARLRKLVALDFSSDDFDTYFYLEKPSFETFISNLSSLRELHLDEVSISSSGDRWSAALANSTPRLQILSLQGCSLSGSIHHSFSRLHSLVEINLSYNVFSGKVPEFFADFPLLSRLDLSYNHFEGQFPTKVCQLKYLRTLDLSGNHKLSGHLSSFPVESKLESLNLLDTHFSDSMPVSIVNLKSLSSLALTTEGTSKELYLIGKLPSLDELNLQGSGLEKPHFSWIGELRHLTSLSISSYNFSEPIPTWIGNLTNLMELDLHSCNFYGAIPSWISNLTQLSDIRFTGNYLTGKIPRYLFTRPEIQTLYLNSNQLSGHLEDIDDPLSSSLYWIDVSDNQIVGTIPESYLELKSLQGLRLGKNKLTGTVNISSFWKLENLVELSLSYNMLSVICEEGHSLFSSLPDIRVLGLVSCNLTELPHALRYLDNIESLNLSNNHIKGVIPSWIWENWKVQLTYLNLSHNMFTSLEKPPSLVAMTSLNFLDLSSNRLEGNVPELDMVSARMLDYSNNYFNSILPNFANYHGELTYLDLSKNKLHGHIPSSICTATKLQILDLSYNYFSGLIPSCLTQCNLTVLKLRGNQVQGALPDNIRDGCMLQTLDFSSNYIEGKLPRSLSNCQDLGLLDVSNNQIADSFPSWLGSLPQLRVLVLRSNQFFGMITDLQGSDRIMKFSSLQILDLSSNSFSGHLPKGWFNELKSMMVNDNDQGQVIGHQLDFLDSFYRDTVTIAIKGSDLIFTKILTTFKVIDLSNNSFGGDIPESIGRLVSLHGLNMSHNNFTGQIPSQIGNLTRLESMDLSCNHLTGGIPEDLSSLTSLAWLNLSYNNLTGRIPQGNQFLSFPNSSFEGNAGLCGSQVSKQCDNASSIVPRASDPPHSNSLWQGRLDAILLFTFVGLGFGVGFAGAIIFQQFCRIDGWTFKH